MTGRRIQLALRVLISSTVLFLPSMAFAEERSGEGYFFGFAGTWSPSMVRSA